MPTLLTFRRRKWILLALFVGTTASTQQGCIRFRNDAPLGADAAVAGDAEVDAEMPPEGGDVIPPPVCARFGPDVPAAIAGELITELVNDCLLRRHFAHLPPVTLIHFEECFTAQLKQIMGCRHPNGQLFKYPIEDSKGKMCRDMKSSHMGLSDGDFDAFIADLRIALDLDGKGLNDDEKTLVLGVFGATRNDIVLLKDAGPTAPCDAPDAN